MIKLLIAARRAPGRTRAAAQAHLLHRHGRMVTLPPADAGAMPADYVQNHVIDGMYPANDGVHAIERDLLTELCFDDMAHLHTSTTTSYYRENLRPDEPRFVDDATAAKMLVAPQVHRDGARGRYKAAWLLTHAGERVDITAATQGGAGRIVVNRVATPPEGARFVDTVVEVWHDDLDAARAAVDAWPFDTAVDRSRSFGIVLEEYPAARIRALLGQSAQ